MADLVGTDYDKREEVMEQLREATRGRIPLQSVGLAGARIVGFGRRPKRLEFLLDIQPALANTISDILRGDMVNPKEELRDLMNESLNTDFNIETPEFKLSTIKKITEDDAREKARETARAAGAEEKTTEGRASPARTVARTVSTRERLSRAGSPRARRAEVPASRERDERREAAVSKANEGAAEAEKN